jgi:hypothetical protein
MGGCVVDWYHNHLGWILQFSDVLSLVNFMMQGRKSTFPDLLQENLTIM